MVLSGNTREELMKNRKEERKVDEETLLKEQRVLLEMYEGMKEDAKNGEITFPLAKLFEQFKERRNLNWKKPHFDQQI